MESQHARSTIRAGRRLAGGLSLTLLAALLASLPKNVLAGSLPDWPWYRQAYALSCEAASEQMVLRYEGFADSQADILYRMGDDSRAGYYDYNGTLRWGNAFKVFVGNVNGSENNLTGYGTYWQVVERVAQSFNPGLVASAGTGISPSTVYADVAEGDPVQVWVTADWRAHTLGHWLTFDGTTWIPYAGPVEHSVDIIGVSDTQVLVADPIGGLGSASHPSPLYWLDKSAFEASYATYQDMAVVYAPVSSGLSWMLLPGSAHDIGAGGGRVFVIGTDAENGGYGIWRWDSGYWTHLPGGGARIAVDPSGDPWVVSAGGAIWRWDGYNWNWTPGPPDPSQTGATLGATDIGIGADGSVFVIAAEPEGGGDAIWQLANGQWHQFPGGGVRVSVDPGGNPWVVNDTHQVWAWNGSSWALLPGGAVDVGAGLETWIASDQAAGGGYTPQQLAQGAWYSAGGGITNAAVGSQGEVYATNDSLSIYEHLSI